MDIGSFSTNYMDYLSEQNSTSSAKLSDSLKNADYSQATQEELLDACKQFEAYFIEQMYKGMLKTIPENEETSNYTSTIMDYYKDQMIQGIAEETSKQSGLGLAQMLYEQMKRNYGITDTPAAEVAAVASASMED